VEVQLGPTDEAHIIRTIEYWDIERKRYPQYEHAAVLIAEDIISRFLNIIALFNGNIPLIALQMQALVFTKVIDEMPRGLVDEDTPTPPGRGGRGLDIERRWIAALVSCTHGPQPDDPHLPDSSSHACSYLHDAPPSIIR
jgi:hypothetical protein